MTLPSFDEKKETSQIFVTAGSGAINIWKDDDNADINNPIFNIPSYPGTSPASITTGSFEITSNNNINKIKNNKITYLASCFKITHHTNPNQFHLIPQNDIERQRREIAMQQEQIIQQNLIRSSRLINVWFYNNNKNRNDTIGLLGLYTIKPNNIEDDERRDDYSVAPLITKLANWNDKLVCVDEWGGIRIIEWIINQQQLQQQQENNNNIHNLSSIISHNDYAYFQLKCQNNNYYQCKIVCMEPIKENFLAVSIDMQRNNNVLDDDDNVDRMILSSASPIYIPNHSTLNIINGVFIIDIENGGIIKGILNAHTDIVRCICPLPDGSILTAGGKMDATVRMWESSDIEEILQHNKKDDDDDDDDDQQSSFSTLPSLVTNAKILKYPGYVFDLKVLQDSNDDSNNVFAVAGARYNLIRIVI